MREILKKTALTIALVRLAAPVAGTAQAPDAKLPLAKVYVRLYDYAKVPPHILHQAKTHAAWVFERAGIEVVWLPDPKIADNSHAPSAETGPDELKRRLCQLSIRIYPPKMSRPLGMGKTVLGYAFQADSTTGFGTTAIAFYGKAESLAKRGIASRSVTLGHIIAHEIGQLLLGNNSHSRSGIMKVPWNRSELKRAATGILHFTPDEVRRIHERLVALEKSAARRAARITMR